MPNKTAADAPKTLPDGAKSIYAATFNAAWSGTCNSDDACAARIAWGAVKKKYAKGEDNKWHRKADLMMAGVLPSEAIVPPKQAQKDDKNVNYVSDSGSIQPCDQCAYFSADTCKLVAGAIAPNGHCDLFEANLQDGGMGMMQMAITKASFDPKTSEMRWTGVASDTDPDKYGERMSLALYRDFIERITLKEPAPTELRSEFWQGGLPYVSVSHYLDLGGYGIAGMAREVFVDGNRFKSKGIFKNEKNPKLAEAAYKAVKADIVGNVPYDQRVRFSIMFVDWQHTHGDYTYVRESLTDKCPLCQFGFPVSEFQKGQLVHLALTRVPVNTRARIGLEERSMTTRKEDATSIVGEEADDLERRSQEDPAVARSAVVERADAEPEAPVEAPVVAKMGEDMAYGGAFTVSDAQAWIDAAQQESRMYDLWYMLQGVMDNIMSSSPEAVPDKAAAVSGAIQDFQKNIQAKAMVTLAQLAVIAQQPVALSEPLIGETQMPHLLDESFEKLRAAYDTVASDPSLSRADKLQKLQEPVNGLAEVVRRGVSSTTPIDSVDVEAAVQRAVAAAIQPIMQHLAGPGAAVRVPASSPAPRQISPGAIATTAAAIKPKSQIRQLVERSVIGSASAPAPVPVPAQTVQTPSLNGGA